MNIHDFRIEGLNGGEIDFSDFKGKKILIVNTASECGLTPQYSQLQELYNSFSDKVIIVGVPANNFGGQEPGNNDQIASFCSMNYGVTFPMTTKLSVVGSDMHPLYQWLTDKEKNGKSNSEVQWNFQKYLIDEQGDLSLFFAPTKEVFDSEIIEALGIKL